MPPLKTIQISPDLLSMNSTRKHRHQKRKQERRQKKNSLIKPNTLKKALWKTKSFEKLFFV